MLVTGSAACQQHSAKADGVAVGITGVDYLADHLSVQRFSVNGISGAQAGKGGRTVCCVTLPIKWQPNMTVEVDWNVTNWRDCSGTEHKATVTVEEYTKVGKLYVSFFPGNEVRVVSSNDPPTKATVPGSKYPIKKLIPQKFPWKVYPPHEHCAESFK